MKRPIFFTFVTTICLTGLAAFGMNQSLAQAKLAQTKMDTNVTGISKIKVIETSQALRLSSSTAKAGELELVIHNRTATPHEFMLLKTTLPINQLPMEHGELNVSAKGIQPIADEFEANNRGNVSQLTVNLPPGHYVVAYNVPNQAKMAANAFTIRG